MHEFNTSSHVPVTLFTNQLLVATVKKQHSKTGHFVKKLQWDKLDKDKFQKSLTNSLNREQYESISTEDKVEMLSELMRVAARSSVPSVTKKLKGPKHRASPKVRELLKLCKSTHTNWKYRHDDSNADSLFLDRKLAKKALRTQDSF